MNETAFIKIPRELLFSPYGKDKELFHLCMTLLGLARFSPAEIDGITVGTGQVLTTGKYLCDVCGISRGKLRHYLSVLTADGFISVNSISKKYTLITVHKSMNTPSYMKGCQ